jgi:hypothetical protein
MPHAILTGSSKLQSWGNRRSTSRSANAEGAQGGSRRWRPEEAAVVMDAVVTGPAERDVRGQLENGHKLIAYGRAHAPLLPPITPGVARAELSPATPCGVYRLHGLPRAFEPGCPSLGTPASDPNSFAIRARHTPPRIRPASLPRQRCRRREEAHQTGSWSTRAPGRIDYRPRAELGAAGGCTSTAASDPAGFASWASTRWRRSWDGASSMWPARTAPGRAPMPRRSWAHRGRRRHRAGR